MLDYRRVIDSVNVTGLVLVSYRTSVARETTECTQEVQIAYRRYILCVTKVTAGSQKAANAVSMSASQECSITSFALALKMLNQKEGIGILQM